MKDQSSPEFSTERALSADQASRLLQIGIAGPQRAADALVERLAQPDGATWLAKTLTTGPVAALGDPEELLARGKIGLEQLRSIKQESTDRALNETHGARLPAMAHYFLSIASGLVHFQTNLSTRPRDDLEAVFLDLAAVTPAAWSDLLEHAAAAAKPA